jgi:hypothetical protein
MMLLEQGVNADGFYAADKVVGKATAFLYVRLGVAAVYAAVISEAAVAVLQEHGVAVESDRVVPFIINRRGDGMCPFEAAVTEVTDPAKAYAVIRRKMEEMHILGNAFLGLNRELRLSNEYDTPYAVVCFPLQDESQA